MTEAATLKPIPERLALLPEIELKVGAHDAPAEDCTRPEGCSEELCNWMLGLGWSDHTETTDASKSPVIAAFRRTLNDNLPTDLRQQMKDSLFWGIGTAGDGRDEDRAWMCADWAIRVALPTWLELAGTKDAAVQLRELPEVTADTVTQARALVDPLADSGWRRWEEAIAEMKAKVRKAVEEEFRKQGASAAEAAGAAEAARAARAAEAARAAGAAGAAEAARAARAAGAAGAAGAARAARAAEAAGAARAAEAARLRKRIYDAVYEAITEQFAPVQKELLSSAFDLMKRMSELEPAK